MYILDIECYSNYFLMVVKSAATGAFRMLEMHNDIITKREILPGNLKNKTLVTFNGNAYDLHMVCAFKNKKGVTNADLKKLSDNLINNQKVSMMNRSLDHIDLINVVPGVASLKIYGGRLHTHTMQDLPLPPDAVIKDEHVPLLRKYCKNDVNITHDLLNSQTKQIEIRTAIEGEDLRSKSDAQMAEVMIKERIGCGYVRPPSPPEYVKYKNPKIITFHNPLLKDMFQKILETEFQVSDSGSVVLPDYLKKPITLHGKKYKMGIGGLHSCESKQYVSADRDHLLCDWDVASYYPNIIIQQKLYPPALGRSFMRVYEGIVKERLEAKAIGDKTKADTLKICVNGSFGKFGSKYSALYAPDLLIQTTITGQLALLMLIEKLERNGIPVISANTDGIVCHCHKYDESEMIKIMGLWEERTQYTLERTDYKLVASRDVNNYVAVKTDGSIKGKGVFAPPNLMKNPANRIIYEAVGQFLSEGTPIEQTIINCDNICQFLTVRQVSGGAIWQGQKLGKAIRYYYSKTQERSECIHYVKNGNKVPSSDGAKPLMTLPDTMPHDVDKERYIKLAREMLRDVGAGHRESFSLES